VQETDIYYTCERGNKTHLTCHERHTLTNTSTRYSSPISGSVIQRSKQIITSVMSKWESISILYRFLVFSFLTHTNAHTYSQVLVSIARAERDGTRAETTFRLSLKRTSPFKSVGVSVQSIAGSRGVRIGLSNAGYNTFGSGVRVLATHSIRQFPLHFPSRASPCATRFRTSYTVFNLHVCTLHQQYQSIFLLIQLMHTIIKSQEC